MKGIAFDGDTLTFTGFPETKSASRTRTFTQLASMMNALAIQQGRVLELVDEMVKNSLPEWMAREAQPEEEQTGACRDYDDFFNRTRYTVPEGVLDENGRMEAFNNDLVIRYLDRVVVKDDGYEVAFKAGVTVEVEI